MVLMDRRDGSSPPQPKMDAVDSHNRKSSSDYFSDAEKVEKKRGGWRAVTFILGNETLERLGTIGLLSNFMVYLTRVFHLEQVNAANVINIWFGFTNLTPVVGAFISDAYVGRFKTIAFASFATLLGLLTVTLTASVPQLHPATCNSKDPVSCSGPNKLQFGTLLLGLGFLSIGAGGIRPCSIPFGVDQFDQRSEEGVKGVASFFNWYYLTFTVVLLITQTVVVYIQDQVSWIIGFSIPTGLMACAVVMFFSGMRLYIYVKPEGSIFSSIAQVIVAARKKRKMKLSAEDDGTVTYYDPPVKDSVVHKLHRSNQFRDRVSTMGANTSSPSHRFSLNDRSRKPHKAGFESEISPYKVSPLIVEMKKKNQWTSRFDALKDTNKLLVIKFTAKWCGPCKSLEPKLEQLAVKYTDVEFVKIDVDVLKSVWKEYNLHALPTVVFMKRGQEVDRVVGLKLDEIEGKLHKYAYSF